jgi:uncharacterized protein (DUF58 family)
MIGSRDLVGFGAAFAGLLLVLLATVTLRWKMRQVVVQRNVASQLICGRPSPVTATMNTPRGGGFVRLDNLTDKRSAFESSPVLFEQHDDGAVSLSYTITPTQPGHFKLGPIAGRFADPFGMAKATHHLGAPTEVVVWPETVPLNVSGISGLVSRRSGFSPSDASDDATLREYVPGDDLRRIHWPTTARRGTAFVRAAEGHMSTPVQLYVDPYLINNNATKNWTLEHVGSLGCSLLEAGHPVRVLGSSEMDFITCQETGRGHILNNTAQLASEYRQDDAAIESLRRTRPGTMTIALVSPKHQIPQGVEGTGRHALLISSEPTGNTAKSCANRLNRAGWHTGISSPAWSHQKAWATVGGTQ